MLLAAKMGDILKKSIPLYGNTDSSLFGKFKIRWGIIVKKCLELATKYHFLQNSPP